MPRIRWFCIILCIDLCGVGWNMESCVYYRFFYACIGLVVSLRSIGVMNGYLYGTRKFRVIFLYISMTC